MWKCINITQSVITELTNLIRIFWWFSSVPNKVYAMEWNKQFPSISIALEEPQFQISSSIKQMD